MRNDEILINQLFAGSYLNEGANIGHEVINLFKDDNGQNYRGKNYCRSHC